MPHPDDPSTGDPEVTQVFYQIVSLAGAFLILLAYGLNQRGRLTPDHAAYSVINLMGALLLLWVAVVDRRAGFILVEAAWAVMSVVPLVRRGPGARPGATV